MGRGLRALGVTAFVIAAAPATAAAHAVVTVRGGVLRYEAIDGGTGFAPSANRLVVRQERAGLRFRDAQVNGGIQAHDCVPVTEREVLCAARGVSLLEINVAELDDVVDLTGVRVPARVDGGTGNDVLTAGRSHAWLLGGEGDDQLRGGASGDVLDGGPGTDRFSQGAGDDLIDEGSRPAGDDRTAPVPLLWGAARQRPFRQGRVLRVKIAALELVTARATATLAGRRLRARPVRLRIGRTATLTFRLDRPAARSLRRAGRARTLVALTATDAAGNRASRRLRITAAV